MQHVRNACAHRNLRALNPLSSVAIAVYFLHNSIPICDRKISLTATQMNMYRPFYTTYLLHAYFHKVHKRLRELNEITKKSESLRVLRYCL